VKYLSLLVIVGCIFLITSSATALDSLSIHLKEGGKAFSNNDYPQAIEHFGKALTYDSNNTLALQSLGVIYSDIGKYKQSLAYLDRVLALDSTNASAYNSRGITMLGLKDTTAALQMHRQAVKLAPEKTRYAVNLGNLLFGMKRLNELLVTMQQTLKHDTTNAQVYYLIGRGLLAANKQYECVNYFNQAYRIKPNNINYEYYRAVAQHETDNVVEAEVGLKDVIKKSPNHFDARMRLGVMYILADRTEEAKEQFEEAVRIKPGSDEARVALGSAYMRLGMTNEAEEIYTWLKQRNPNAAAKMRRLGNKR